jgi:hypothetical protein
LHRLPVKWTAKRSIPSKHPILQDGEELWTYRTWEVKTNVQTVYQQKVLEIVQEFQDDGLGSMDTPQPPTFSSILLLTFASTGRQWRDVGNPEDARDVPHAGVPWHFVLPTKDVSSVL